jgi:hypothetical protein
LDERLRPSVFSPSFLRGEDAGKQMRGGANAQKVDAGASNPTSIVGAAPPGRLTARHDTLEKLGLPLKPG